MSCVWKVAYNGEFEQELLLHVYEGLGKQVVYRKNNGMEGWEGMEWSGVARSQLKPRKSLRGIFFFVSMMGVGSVMLRVGMSL